MLKPRFANCENALLNLSSTIVTIANEWLRAQAKMFYNCSFRQPILAKTVWYEVTIRPNFMRLSQLCISCREI